MEFDISGFFENVSRKSRFIELWQG